MAHNHPPACCCKLARVAPPDQPALAYVDRCPSCVEHGDLANPSCHNCHQLPGRPHTEYCPRGPGTVK